VYLEIADLATAGPYAYIAVDAISEEAGPIGIAGDPPSAAPAALRVGAAFPNPCRTGATVPIALEAPGTVRLGIYDVQGRLRRLVYHGRVLAGRHDLDWDGRADDGARLGPGVYFLRLESGGRTDSRKIVISP
jgi:hypothetical protein